MYEIDRKREEVRLLTKQCCWRKLGSEKEKSNEEQ